MTTPPFTPADHLAAVRRSLFTGTRDGIETRVLAVERSYGVPPEEVWEAITSRERIPRWLMPISGDLELGGRYQLEGNAGGEILVCERPERLSVTWVYGDNPTSWVDVSLVPEGEETVLRVEHSAPTTPEGEEMWEQFGPGAIGIGWEQMVLGLTLHLAEPEAEKMDPMAAENLPILEEFTVASGQSWVEADIAFGTDPEQARAAGERCVAAYTAPPE